MSFVIASAIITPDGTILQSYHKRDLKSHIDLNGETYFIDGGIDDTLMYSANDVLPKVIIVTTESDFIIQRAWFSLPFFNNDDSFIPHYVRLKDISDYELDTYYNKFNNPQSVISNLITKEKKYRLNEILQTELKSNTISDCLINKVTDVSDNETVAIHADWYKYLLEKHSNISKENAYDILQEEVGFKFLEVLCHAGVFKRDETGLVAFDKFINTL